MKKRGGFLSRARGALPVVLFFLSLVYAFYRADGIADVLIYAAFGAVAALLLFLLLSLLCRLFRV